MNKKIVTLILIIFFLLTLSACKLGPSEVKVFTGKGDGYGGVINAIVTCEDGNITKVELTAHNESRELRDKVIEELPSKIVQANSADIDGISGATITSDAVLYAVKNALDPNTYPYPKALADRSWDTSVISIVSSNAYQGTYLDRGASPGLFIDAEGVDTYAVNEVAVNGLFDENGRILALYIDHLEYLTPNYDEEVIAHFSGFPGQGGYNYDENHDTVIVGKTEDTEENFLKEISEIFTKRDRGDHYRLGMSNWTMQVDGFQEMFVGKTVDEVEEWFKKYCSDTEGKPLKITDESEEADRIKYNALTDEERSVVADIVSKATISLKSIRGDIVGAIRKAYENRVLVDIKSAQQIGIGISSNGIIGDNDSEGVPIYTINQVFAYTILDKNNKIAALYIDQLDVSSPNHPEERMMHFPGYPGQTPYNYDSDHDGIVDGKMEITEDGLFSMVKSWITNREQGNNYMISNGTWSSEMDKLQKTFIGMTKDEVEIWANKYCSDVDGSLLKKNEIKNEEDIVKYNLLTNEEKQILEDLPSDITYDYRYIIEAIIKSFENMSNIDIVVR